MTHNATTPPHSASNSCASSPSLRPNISHADITNPRRHSIAIHAKSGSPLLIVTSWTPAELATNLPPSVTQLIHDRKLRVYTIDARQLAERLAGAAGRERDAVENVFVLLAFLRLYLGKAASEDVVVKLARRFVGDAVSGFDLVKIGARAWAGLVEIDLPAVDDSAPANALKSFEFNAIAIQTEEGDTVVNGARLGSWHDAAKHLLFPSAFTPVAPPASSYEQNPALRPELPERTYLITTTTVNIPIISGYAMIKPWRSSDRTLL